MRCTCIGLPYSSSSPCKTRVGQKISCRQSSIFQFLKSGRNQVSAQAWNTGSVLSPWYLASFWGNAVVLYCTTASRIPLRVMSSTKICAPSVMMACMRCGYFAAASKAILPPSLWPNSTALSRPLAFIKSIRVSASRCI
ncbi:hypothetical protein D3C72_1724050 [compost metagenome]